jgi:hypothetical protein
MKGAVSVINNIKCNEISLVHTYLVLLWIFRIEDI